MHRRFQVQGREVSSRNEGWIAERAARFGGEGGTNKPSFKRELEHMLSGRHIGVLTRGGRRERKRTFRIGITICQPVVLLFSGRETNPLFSFPPRFRRFLVVRSKVCTRDAGNSVVALHTFAFVWHLNVRRGAGRHLPRPSWVVDFKILTECFSYYFCTVPRIVEQSRFSDNDNLVQPRKRIPFNCFQRVKRSTRRLVDISKVVCFRAR